MKLMKHSIQKYDLLVSLFKDKIYIIRLSPNTSKKNFKLSHDVTTLERLCKTLKNLLLVKTYYLV